jgi:hypothetical protein
MWLAMLDCDSLPETDTPPETDIRVAQAQGLAESGQFLDAARMAGNIWFGGPDLKPVYDVRVVGYLLFGAVLDDGVAVLPTVVRCLHKLAGAHWDKLHPSEEARAPAFTEAMGWLLSKLYNRVVVSEQEKDAEWRWLIGERGQLAALVGELRALPTLWQEKELAAARSQSLPGRMLKKLSAQLERARNAPLPAPGAPGPWPTLQVGEGPSPAKGEVQGPAAAKVPKLADDVLALLDAPLPAASEGAEELPGEPPELAQAQDLAQRGKYRAAAAVAAELWKGAEGTPRRDVRLLGYLLYAAYLQAGVKAMPRILRCWQRLAGEGWAALVPQATRGRHLPIALAWFLSSLHNHLRLSELEEGSAWQTLSANSSLREEMTAELDKLPEAWAAVLGDAPASTAAAPAAALRRLRELLSDFSKPKVEAVNESPSPADPPQDDDESEDQDEAAEHDGAAAQDSEKDGAAKSDAPEDDDEDKDEKSDSDDEKSASADDGKTSDSEEDDSDDNKKNDSDEDENKKSVSEDDEKSGSEDDEDTEREKQGSGRESDSGSDGKAKKEESSAPIGDKPSAEFLSRLDLVPLARLEQQLGAFETLLGREDHERAALVAVLVQESVARFDPRALLAPALARFYARLAEKAEQLEPEMKKGESLRARALLQLCRLDLGAFLKKDG